MQYSRIRNKTFILGAGAQKTGTSWLFDYFSGFDEITCPPLKELHVFDVKYRPDLCARFCFSMLGQLRDMLDERISSGDLEFDDKLKFLIARARMVYDLSAYLDYFDSIMKDGATHMCEITPAYSLIGADGLAEMKDLFAQAGLKLKIIFLMRDPIDRYYSALRMRQIKTKGKVNEEKDFLEYLHNPMLFERGRYDITIRNLLSVFPEKDIYFGFYEDLFSEQEIKKLTAFLGLAYVTPDFSRIIKDSPGVPERELTEVELKESRQAFAPVYDYCREYFGGRLPASWRV